MWPASPAQRARHARAVAEPPLNAWAALALGDPARVRYGVARLDPVTGDPVEDTLGDPLDPAEFTLAEVGLCRWDVLAASAPPAEPVRRVFRGTRIREEVLSGGAGPPRVSRNQDPRSFGRLCRIGRSATRPCCRSTRHRRSK
jgi:hypothetical protein